MISFIIAVFHRPRLVVLDEPTIGLDVLKKNQYLPIFNSFKNVNSMLFCYSHCRVWRYLHHMITTWKPTVVVATNNIEEAFLATKVQINSI